MNNSGFSERQLQEAVHEILSDPSIVRRTVSGKRLQILSPGRLNVHAGPDFSETAVLTEGTIFVGDSEFHRRSSEWFAHNHHKDPAYDKVVLHIVFDDNSRVSQGCEILKLDAETVEQKVIELESREKEEVDIFSVEELQHYALLRLLRKTSEVQKILNFCTLEETVKQVTEDFLNRYNAKRTRPVYTDDDLEDILKAMPQSAAYGFLNRLSAGASLNIPDIMIDLLKQKILNEGAHLRREIALNCVLPTALCLA
ncbi:MAG: DUF2851 family protein, partial [Chlorobi bacterium]|nr:DUF2851 family protein [Chlorobiota bacterium]